LHICVTQDRNISILRLEFEILEFFNEQVVVRYL
jgi:hypothetical protein